MSTKKAAPVASGIGAPQTQEHVEATLERVSVAFQQAGNVRTLPKQVDEMCNQNGYALSTGAVDSASVGRAAVQERKMLRVNDLPEAKRQDLIADCSLAGFEVNEADGSFRRADVALFWQSKQVRDRIRVERKKMWDMNFSATRTEAEVDEMNYALQEQHGAARVEVLSGADPGQQVSPGTDLGEDGPTGLMGRTRQAFGT